MHNTFDLYYGLSGIKDQPAMHSFRSENYDSIAESLYSSGKKIGVFLGRFLVVDGFSLFSWLLKNGFMKTTKRTGKKPISKTIKKLQKNPNFSQNNMNFQLILLSFLHFLTLLNRGFFLVCSAISYLNCCCCSVDGVAIDARRTLGDA